MIQAFNFPRNLSIDAAIKRFKVDFKLKKEFAWSGNRCFYDSFDWRLYNRSMLLYSEQDKMCLKSINSLKIQDSMTIQKIPKFTADLPSGTFRDRLSSILEMRALIKLNCLHIDHIKYRILDKNDKTNLYLVMENNRLKVGPKSYHSFAACILLPIKGYENSVIQMSQWLQTNGFTQFKKNILEKVLEYHTRHPNDYSSKIDIKLSANMTASEAAKSILVSLFNTMKKNQHGIIEDIDSEFLHDYRVAIRRIRSVFGQLKNIFEKDIYIRAKKDFKYLIRLTNRKRDLDVYGLKEEKYKMMLPTDMQMYIKPFFVKTNKEERIQHNKIANYLVSDEYNILVNYWEKFFNSSLTTQQGGLKSEKNVLLLAKNIIYNRYKRVIKLGDSITKSSSNSLLHKLRIECKKLRYLLEFFSSLFAQNDIDYLIKQLKKLQDNLGEYNDLTIQQNTLRDFIEVRSNKNTLLAVGVLIGKLHDIQLSVKKSFAGSYKYFASRKIKNKFYQMFAAPTGMKS